MTEDAFQAMNKLKAANFEAGLKEERSNVNFSIDQKTLLMNEIDTFNDQSLRKNSFTDIYAPKSTTTKPLSSNFKSNQKTGVKFGISNETKLLDLSGVSGS